jgi:hypothetical protein
MNGSSTVRTLSQPLPVVADVQVGRHVPADLGIASAEGRQHREREQLAHR